MERLTVYKQKLDNVMVNWGIILCGRSGGPSSILHRWMDDDRVGVRSGKDQTVEILLWYFY